MKQYPLVMVMLVVVLALLTTSTQVAAQAQEMDPAEIVQAIYEAVGAKDVDAALALVADDAVLVLIPPPEGLDGTFIGKQEIGAWYEGLAADNGRAEFSDVFVAGNTASLKLAWYSDFFDRLGIAPAEFDGVAVVQEGRLKAVSWVFTPEFNAKMAAAMALEMNKVLAHRYLEEMWDEGDMAVADEIIADDFVDYNPMFGNAPDKAGIMAQATGFHEGGLKNRIDDLIVSEDSIVLRVTVMEPGEDNELQEGLQAVLLLGVEDGQIIDRRAALFGFGPPWEN